MLLVQRLLALGRPAAHGGLVHDVVVVQRRQVGQLADDGRLGHLRRRADRPAGRPAGPASAGTACRPRTSGGRPPRGRTGARCRRRRQRRLDAAEPVGERRAERSLGEPGADGRRRGGDPVPATSVVGAVDCGTGSGHQPTKIAACSARSSTDPGTMPSARVAVAVIASTIVVGSPGTPTVGPVGRGRREVHEHDDPQVEERGHRAGQQRRPGPAARRPASMAARNTANFPVKPAVSGMPASASRKSAITAAVSGDRDAEPRPLRQVRRLAVAVADQREDGEGADRRQPVGQQVEHRGREAGAVAARRGRGRR